MGGNQLPIGIGDLEQALRDDTRVTAQHWKVAANPAPTATVFGVTDLAGAPVLYGPKALAALVGAVAEFLTGTLGGDAAAATPKQGALVTAAALGGAPGTIVLTVEALFSGAPAAGDELALLATPTTTGTQDVNITGATIQAPTDLQGIDQPAADSTTATLGANGVYTTATPFNLADARGIIGSLLSDVGGTLQVQQSPNVGTNWDVVKTYFYPGGSEGLEIVVPVAAPGGSQGRLVYTNGPTAQTTMRLFVNTTPQPVERQVSLPTQAAATQTITAGGASQSLFAALPGRRLCQIQNPSTAAGQGIAAAESLWYNVGVAAVVGPPSTEVVTGALIILDTVVDPQAINVIAATTGHAFSARQA